MPHCAFKSCTSRSSTKTKAQQEMEKKMKITFHRFPRAEGRRLQWANRAGLALTTLPKNAYLCSLHFAPESFDRTSLCCIRLRERAIPFASESNEAPLCDVTASVSSNKIVSDETPPLTPDTRPADDICAPKQSCENSLYSSTVHTRPTSDISTQTTEDIDSSNVSSITKDKATAISPERTWNTPTKTLLRKTLQNERDIARRKIQALEKQNKRQGERIAALKSIINQVKEKNLPAA